MIYLQVRTPDGKVRRYAAGRSKQIARREAIKMISRIAYECKDDRILWKLTGDRDWNMGAKIESRSRKFYRHVEKTTESAKKAVHNVLDYFFELDEPSA